MQQPVEMVIYFPMLSSWAGPCPLLAAAAEDEVPVLKSPEKGLMWVGTEISCNCGFRGGSLCFSRCGALV